jgi:quercetin dioxygenase-like cupin family protein
MEEGSKKVKVLNNCIGKSQSLVGLVEYAKDSIVSKTILDSEIGTITLFAFDAGQKLSEHTSPYNAVVQVVDGYGEFIIAGDSSEVSAGELLIMPADIPHSVSAVEKFKMLLTMIRI